MPPDSIDMYGPLRLLRSTARRGFVDGNDDIRPLARGATQSSHSSVSRNLLVHGRDRASVAARPVTCLALGTRTNHYHCYDVS